MMWASVMGRQCCPPWMCFRPGWFGRGIRQRWPTKADLVRWLEGYKRELEEELSDVAGELQRLKDQDSPA